MADNGTRVLGRLMYAATVAFGALSVSVCHPRHPGQPQDSLSESSSPLRRFRREKHPQFRRRSRIAHRPTRTRCVSFSGK